MLAPKEFIAEAGRRIFGGSHGFQVDHMIFKGNEAITKTSPKVSFIPQYHSKQKRKLPTSDEIILKRKQNTSKKKMCLSATDPIVRTATNSSVHFIAKSEAKDHLVNNLNRMPSKKRHLRRLPVAFFGRFKSGTCKFFFTDAASKLSSQYFSCFVGC